MSGITKMNGKPLQFFSFGDMGDPKKRHQIGKHTSVEAAERMFKRMVYRGASPYGWTWIEPISDVGYTLTEVILKPHRRWAHAQALAFEEWKDRGPNPIISVATCCSTAGGWINEHQKTVRHFRYWCLEMQRRAIGNWPWLREVMAEEILSGVGE